ncbi:hypothetical protein INT47_000667 [Mucor saturninus]|uniref:E3 ubiquitin protein ligase n=1 Tax=Mucor saturninus TaxID=64648 RepID=A0A8H7V9Y7_9FUNG|nr:hypothetical protein INT47_000667 [Mucor saturninus]
MAKIEDNTKRRSNEMDEQSVTSIPPKKRFLSRASSPDEEDDQDDDHEDASDSFKEPLEAFRKDAIMRQWKEYMRSVKRWKKYVEQAEQNRSSSEEHLRLWEDSFKQLQVFLSNIIQESMSSLGQSFNNAIDVNTQDFEHVLQEEWATDLAPNMSTAFKNKDYNDSTIAKLNQLMESWITKREDITTGFESVFVEDGSLKEIKKSHSRILASWVHTQRSLSQVKNRYKLSNFKYLFLSEELRILNNRLELTESNLRQAQSELEKQELKNLVKTEDAKKPSITIPTPVPAVTAAATTATATEIFPVTNPASTTNTTNSTASTAFNNPDNSHDPLIRAQQILEQKLHDIELIKEDRILLKQQIARLEMDLICVPESRIYKAPICRNLSQSRVYHKDKCNHLSNICHDLTSTLEDLTSNRRKLIKELDTGQVNYFKEMRDQLAKLDGDLTRIRGERDKLQMHFEEKKASSEIGRASIAELKVIADTRKERVNYLETEVLRLQKKMAARTGVKEYYDLLLNSDGREPLLLPLQNQLKALEEQLEQKKASLHIDNLDQELAHISEMKQLELEADAFQNKYGFHPSAPMDDLNVQKVLQDRIENEKRIISESQEKIQSLEATEKQLLSEIESVSNAYAELEDGNMDKVKELYALEEEVLKLQSERVKYNHTFTALNKTKDALSMVANSLSKQGDKQLAHIKQMNEREKNLVSQSTCLKREYDSSKAVYEIYKQKSEETKLTLDELKEKALFAKDKIAELQTSILDKIRLIEEGAHTRLRLEESSELLKRKVDSTNKVEKPAEMKLRKEREEYRLIYYIRTDDLGVTLIFGTVAVNILEMDFGSTNICKLRSVGPNKKFNRTN